MVLNFLHPGHFSPHGEDTPSTQATCHHACVYIHVHRLTFSLQMTKQCIIFNERLGLLEYERIFV